MKHLKSLVIAAVVIVTAAFQVKAESQNRILVVVSSYGEDDGKTKPGYEFSEFAKAYLVFKEHGIDIDIASPKGGAVVADEFDKEKSFNKTVLMDKAVMDKLNNTIAISSVSANRYDGVYVVGGKGAMFDFPNDKSLQDVIVNVYEKDGVVAAVCHGPAAFVNVKLSNGNYLVDGKNVNGFTNQEEKMFGKKWIKSFDFLLQDKLIERGAKFEHAPFMLSHVAVDGRLITAQNPSSTTGSALAMVEALGIKTKAMKKDSEDATLALVADYLSGDQVALTKLADQSLGHQIPLVGMYGFYFSNTAKTNKTKEQALALMLVAQDVLKNPKLDMQIAKSQKGLGKTEQAKRTLERVLLAVPDHKGAKEMMATL